MLLIAHIVIGFASVAYATCALIKPSKDKITVVLMSVAITFMTGTYMLFGSPGHLTQSCIVGTIYIAYTMYCLAGIERKLKVAV